MRLASLLLVALAGCAPLTLALHATTNYGSGHWDETTPLGKDEHRLVVDTVPLASEPMPPAPEPPPAGPVTVTPPNVVLVEPPPAAGPVTVTPPNVVLQEPSADGAQGDRGEAPPPPGGLIGPPLGTAPLHFACRSETRNDEVKVVDHYAEYDVIEKLWMGFVGVFDATVGYVGLSDGFAPERKDRTSSVVIGSLAVADLVGIVALIVFEPTRWGSETWTGPGDWHADGQACPAGLVARAGGETAAIDSTGHLADTDEAKLVRALVTTPAPLELKVGELSRTVDLSELVRCEWRVGRQYALGQRCVGQGAGVPEVVFPLE